MPDLSTSTRRSVLPIFCVHFSNRSAARYSSSFRNAFRTQNVKSLRVAQRSKCRRYTFHRQHSWIICRKETLSTVSRYFCPIGRPTFSQRSEERSANELHTHTHTHERTYTHTHTRAYTHTHCCSFTDLTRYRRCAQCRSAGPPWQPDV